MVKRPDLLIQQIPGGLIEGFWIGRRRRCCCTLRCSAPWYRESRDFDGFYRPGLPADRSRPPRRPGGAGTSSAGAGGVSHPLPPPSTLFEGKQASLPVVKGLPTNIGIRQPEPSMVSEARLLARQPLSGQAHGQTWWYHQGALQYVPYTACWWFRMNAFYPPAHPFPSM